MLQRSKPLKRGTATLKRSPIKRSKKRPSQESKALLPMHRRTLQELFNTWVRERDKICQVRYSPAYQLQYGECKGVLNASHIFPQGSYPSLRYDPQNVIAKCAYHHKHWWHAKTAESQEWIREHMKGEYEALRLRALNLSHPWIHAKELIALKECLRKEPQAYPVLYRMITECPINTPA